jgi:hypothetical protein
MDTVSRQWAKDRLSLLRIGKFDRESGFVPHAKGPVQRASADGLAFSWDSPEEALVLLVSQLSFGCGRYPNLPRKSKPGSYYSQDPGSAEEQSQASYIYSLLAPMHPHSKFFTGSDYQTYSAPSDTMHIGIRTMVKEGTSGKDFGRSAEFGVAASMVAAIDASTEIDT